MSNFDREQAGSSAGADGPGERFPIVEPLALRAKDAARALGIGERQLWSLTKAGKIPCVRIGRTTTYPVDALRDWLKKRAKGGK